MDEQAREDALVERVMQRLVARQLDLPRRSMDDQDWWRRWTNLGFLVGAWAVPAVLVVVLVREAMR
jgi:hypothetical protein